MRPAFTSPRLLTLLLCAGLVGGLGCRSDDSADDDAAGLADSGVPDAALDGGPDAGESCDTLAAGCVSEFGNLFTQTDGRADGTLIAMVRPRDTDCAMVNNDHAVLELSILGNVQRLVVSLDGVAVLEVSAPLEGPPFEEGWHEGMTLDYPTDLGVSSDEFTSVSMDDAVAFLCAELTLGAQLSIYAYSDGSYPSSAHEVHRNDNYPDGAIVVAPDSANPTWLLFRYADQQF